VAGSIEERIQRIAEGLRVETPLGSQGYQRASLSEQMARYAIPGVSIAMIDGGEVSWARGWGVRDATSAEPVTADTLFQAGSISKPVAALAALRLASDGKLDLKEDVNAYLRSWRVPANDGWQPHLSMRQLLSHSAGLSVHGFPGYPRDHALPTVPQILDGEMPANTGPVRVTIVPGTQFRYSGGGTTIAQLVLSDLTGTPFPDLLRELVLNPLGMHASGYEQPLPIERWGQAASGHRAGGQPVSGGWHVYPEMAAAGLWSTPTDLARYAIGVMDAWHGKPNAILSQEMARQMLTPILPTHPPFAEGLEAFIALGHFVNGDQDEPSFSHAGSDEGFTSLLVAWPARRQGVVLMTNTDSNRGARELIGETLRAVAAEYHWPGILSDPQSPIGVTIPADPSVTGEYVLASGFRLILFVEDGTLRLSPQSQPPITLSRISGNVWTSPTLNTRVELTEDEGGQVTGLVLHQDGQTLEARRKR
jgi:CubicO group peptidase (beta-lactamase class C family)